MSRAQRLLAKVEVVQEGSDPKECSSVPSAIGSLLHSPFVNPELPLLPSIGNNGKQLEKQPLTPQPTCSFVQSPENSQDSDNFVEANRGLGQ